MLASSRAKVLVVASAALVVFAVAFAIGGGETTAALTLLGAVVVAALAAWTAELRLSRQLAAAAERHERELALAQERQERQLQHDREQRAADRAHERDLAALAELRILLDDATTLVRAAGSSLHGLADNVRSTKHFDAVSERMDELHDACTRLALRLGYRHDVVTVTLKLEDVLTRCLNNVVMCQEEEARAQAVVDSFAPFSHATETFENVVVETTDSIAARLGTGAPPARQKGQAPSA